MGNPSSLFSFNGKKKTRIKNPDYYLNTKFISLIKQWKLYLESDEDDDDILTVWEEIIRKDFRLYANEWRNKNKNKTAWRKELR